MGKAHPSAGQNQKSPNPEWRRRVALRRLEEPRILDKRFEQQQQKGSKNEADNGRNEERAKHIPHLRPIDPAGSGRAGHQLVSYTDADD